MIEYSPDNIHYNREFINQMFPDDSTTVRDANNLHSILLHTLIKELDWVQVPKVPRREYYWNKSDVPYTYGSGRGIRTYQPQPTHPILVNIIAEVERQTGCVFDVAFLNHYQNERDHLGWHADDSPEMDDDRPIAVITLGPLGTIKADRIDRNYRMIQFKYQNDNDSVCDLALHSGSLLLMGPGFQDKFYHRIPKCHFTCTDRVSITLRGYKEPTA